MLHPKSLSRDQLWQRDRLLKHLIAEGLPMKILVVFGLATWAV